MAEHERKAAEKSTGKEYRRAPWPEHRRAPWRGRRPFASMRTPHSAQPPRDPNHLLGQAALILGSFAGLPGLGT